MSYTRHTYRNKCRKGLEGIQAELLYNSLTEQIHLLPCKRVNFIARKGQCSLYAIWIMYTITLLKRKTNHRCYLNTFMASQMPSSPRQYIKAEKTFVSFFLIDSAADSSSSNLISDSSCWKAENQYLISQRKTNCHKKWNFRRE